MFVPTGERPDGRSASALLASMPWLVVLVGAGLMIVLLVVALLSTWGTGRESAPPPAPPLYLPTLPAASDPAEAVTAAPRLLAANTPSPTLSPSARSASPTAAVPVPAARGGSGRLAARYLAVDSQRGSFTAELVVTNGSARAQDWQVELLFAGNVKGIQASGSPVTVTSQGNGVFTLRGTAALASGRSTTVPLRFARNGTGDRPGQCTVNGSACTIG